MKKLLVSGMILTLLAGVSTVCMASSSYFEVKTDNMWLLKIYELNELGDSPRQVEVTSVRELGGFCPNEIYTNSIPDYVRNPDYSINGQALDSTLYGYRDGFVRGIQVNSNIDPQKEYIIRCATEDPCSDDMLWTEICNGNELNSSYLLTTDKLVAPPADK